MFNDIRIELVARGMKKPFWPLNLCHSIAKRSGKPFGWVHCDFKDETFRLFDAFSLATLRRVSETFVASELPKQAGQSMEKAINYSISLKPNQTRLEELSWFIQCLTNLLNSTNAFFPSLLRLLFLRRLRSSEARSQWVKKLSWFRQLSKYSRCQQKNNSKQLWVHFHFIEIY